MHDLPRQKLIEIVTHRRVVAARFGRDVVDDPKLCKALLLDLCGEYRREISALVAAVEERVPHDLQTMPPNTPLDVLLTRLTRRLVDDRALAEDAARWAVESWALALGHKLPQPAAPTVPVVSAKPVPPAVTVSTTPTSSPPTPGASNMPYVFSCTWEVEVWARPSGNVQTEWKYIGSTPSHVTVPAHHEVGLCPHGVSGDALTIWISELVDPAVVQWLKLDRDEVDDAGLKSLRVFTNLTHLYIHKADKITDAGLAHLDALPRLAHLWINSNSETNSITNRGMIHLKNLTGLTNLSLHKTRVTDDGLEHLESLIHLVKLRLFGAPIRGYGLTHLQGLASLASLDLFGTLVDDAGIVGLKALINLTSLDLGLTKITDTGLVHLQGLTNLMSLCFWSCEITGAGLVHLHALTNLMKLDLHKCTITDVGLVHLRELTNLTDLDLHGCSNITDAGAIHLRALINLKNLNIRNCCQITERGSAALQRPGLTIKY